MVKIHAALKVNPSMSNLFTDREFADDLIHRQQSLRRIVTLAVASGIPVPALSASICYYDQIRTGILPTNLIQAQRDFFGGHAYERVDSDGLFHTRWTPAHHDIGDASARTAGSM